MRLKHIFIVQAVQEELVKHRHYLDGSLIYLCSCLWTAYGLLDVVIISILFLLQATLELRLHSTILERRAYPRSKKKLV